MSVPSTIQIALREELKSVDNQLQTYNVTLQSLNAKRSAIVAVLHAYGEEVPSGPGEIAVECSEGSQLDSLDMARRVIRNAGRPLSHDDIRAAVYRTFGVHPVKTLHEMLNKRVKSGDKGFYKDDEGNIGLMEMMPVLTTVHTAVSTGA